jgi:hypothetical protein
MSNALAIAAVTAVIRARLLDSFGSEWTSDPSNPRVVAVPPNQVIATDETGPVLNLFLFAVHPNPTASNVPHPERAGEPEARNGRSFTLEYLIAAHGILALDAEILLGHALVALQSMAVLTPDAIRSTLDPGVPSPSGMLTRPFREEAVKLADSVDAIQITTRQLTIDSLTSLWRSFRTPYRPGVMIEATGVWL